MSAFPADANWRSCMRDAKQMIGQAREWQARGYPHTAAVHLRCAKSVLGCATYWRKRYRLVS